jgi:hypothetical protein
VNERDIFFGHYTSIDKINGALSAHGQGTYREVEHFSVYFLCRNNKR